MEDERRAYDKNITTLTLAVERLAENQTVMAGEVRELTKAISKMDVVLEKMANMESRHITAFASVDDRIKVLEKSQTEGCPALKEMRVGYDGKYEKVLENLQYNRKNIESIQSIVSRVAWAIATAVGMALLALVIK